MRRKTALFVFAALLLFQTKIILAGPIQTGDRLTLEKCLDIARTMNPQILTAEQAVNASQSRIGQAKANYYPQLNVSSGYNHGWSSTGTASGSSDQFSANIGVSQNIWDFGKTSTQVKVSNLNLDSASFNLGNVSSQIVLQVKQYYYQLLQAQKAEGVSREAVAQYQKHLEQAQGFYETGRSPKFDVTKAQVDLGNARLDLINAENASRIALVNLNNAMGLLDAPEYTVEDNLALRHPEIILADALETAYRNRPDLNAAVTQREAAGLSVDLVRKGYYPTLSGSAGYGWSGGNFPPGNDSWSAGVTLSVPIFNGFSTKYKVDEAGANFQAAKSQEETARQGVSLDVKQAYLTLQSAEAKIPVAELTVTQARENLELANGRYEAGVGSPIEVTDSQAAYSQARYAYIQTLYQYQIAQAGLDKAIGVQ
ncbi:MAG: TolC family protein [Candidatus Ratteibacteria bacterium]